MEEGFGLSSCVTVLGSPLKDQMINLSWDPGEMVLLLRRGPNTRPVHAIPELRREGESIEE